MAAAWSLLIVAPVAAFVLLGYAFGPRASDGWPAAPIRLAAIRAALAVGGYAVISVEAGAALDALTRPGAGVIWLIGLALAATAAVVRRRLDERHDLAPRRRPIDAWRAAGGLDRAMVVALGAILLAEAVLALLAEPNNYDSQTYHLPRIEHWVTQRDVGFYATAIHRQITLAPGAEYLLLHLRLLTGGDSAYHLVQWAAGIGCLVAASRIAAQLGGSRRAQLITALLLGTTPMVVLQASSTQNDLVAAAWTACAGTLALDGLARRARVGDVLALGTATGLTAITKNSGLLAVIPMLLLWAAGQIKVGPRYAQSAAIATTALAGAVAVAAILVGPFMTRIAAEFGHPLGPPRLRESVSMQRHDPGSVLVNGLRIGHTALDTPARPLAKGGAEAIIGLARWIGVDPQDRATTFGQTTFPIASWYPDEDRAAFPIAGFLALAATAIALIRPRILGGPARRVRAYAAAVTLAGLLYAVTVKWQPWGNRLLLFALTLAVPLAGLLLAALIERAARRHGPPRRLGVALVTALLATSVLAGVLAAGYGFPRRLAGSGSTLTTDDWQTRFARRPQWADEFRWAAAAIDASGARRLGLVQQNDNWEYPWWLLLRDHDIVALQSVVPHHPAADPSTLDAVICTGTRATCAAYVPGRWRLRYRSYVGYALPPTPS
jgi:4-amino-4-deoxy-L-arabinose transferase-like glycosyltransferase